MSGGAAPATTAREYAGSAQQAAAGGAGASTLVSRIATTSPVMWLGPAIALQVGGALLERADATIAGWQAVGALALLLVGTWLIRSAERELSWNATPVCVGDAPRALVATGPYRFGRHPMYAGAVLVLAGVALVLGSWLAAGVSAGFLLWVDVVHARGEDAALRERFGDAWQRYAAQVRRWA